MAMGIGLAIGDAVAVAAGASGGREWLVAEPAVVAAASLSARVEVLLGGREVGGTEPLLSTPRRWGYLPGEPAVATELLAALLTTLRQRVGPERLTIGGQPVLALPWTLGARAAGVVQEAARRAGWGEVRVVSELTALARGQAGEVPPVRLADGDWEHAATYRLQAGELLLTGLQVQPASGRVPSAGELERLPPAGGTAQPATDPVPSTATEQIAQGAARLAGMRCTVAPDLPLSLGVLTRDGVLPLASPWQSGRVVRAFAAPPGADALLRLVACCAGARGIGQELATLLLPPGGPSLLTLEIGPELQGAWSVQHATGSEERGRFQIRLP